MHMSMANAQSAMAVIRANRPSFRNDHDKVAFAVHATFYASGCLLTATGHPALTPPAFSSSSTDEVGIEDWNELENEYACIYANPKENSFWYKMKVKCLVMDQKLVVDVSTEDDSEPFHLEIEVDDCVHPNGGINYATQYIDLDKLVERLNREIVSHLYSYPPFYDPTS